MQYPIRQLADIIEGEFIGNPPAEAIIEHVLLDSRQVAFPATSIFFALQGQQHDGHDFLEDLYQKGVRNFVISKKEASPASIINHQSSIIIVKNTQEAFHRLAAFHRHQFPLPVVAITGSNGKTIVKEWLYQLLHEDFHIVRSPKSYNSQTGVPLSVLQITAAHNLGIFEAGISKQDEMAKLAPILAPNIGIFTNIGEAHSEGFPDIETKIREKLLLFQHTQTIIYCKDNPLIDKEMQALEDKNFLTWSATGKPATLQITAIFPEGNQTKIEYNHPSSLPELSGQAIPHPSIIPHPSSLIPFQDAASIENAIHCLALLLHLGVSPEAIAARMAKLEPVAMRLELKGGINGCLLVNDSYNSDLTSLGIALDFLEQQSKTPRRTLILSDILQSGQPPEQLYGAVAKLLLEKKIDRVIGVGEAVPLLKKLLPDDFESAFFENTAAFLEQFPALTFRDETILLKGARRFEFERIANRLSTKMHQTTLEVNLTALLHNLRAYQSQLRPGIKLMAMVKASAYGSGSVEVAKLLEFHNVDYLGVAYSDEGVELRKAGIRLPILVMNPEEATFEALLRHGLEPEIYSFGLLEKFARFLESSAADGHTIHLKLDTGMHRLGFEAADIPPLIQFLQARPDMRVASVFSHLAASEAVVHDDFTKMQFEKFERMSSQLTDGLGYRPLRHILNSGGIVRFPAYQFDMVRLGIGLYGIDGSGLLQAGLRTVSTFKATISQIKKIAPGETIGYGRMGKAEVPTRIATLSLGYADGLLRRAGNGRFSVLIHGKRAPLIGNVCMDMVMADITHIPTAQEGDPVIIFGKDLPVEELAACLGTIPYEIFTTISERVKRVYVQE